MLETRTDVLQNLAHAGHQQLNNGTELKGGDAIAVTGIAVIIVFTIVFIFYRSGGTRQ